MSDIPDPKFMNEVVKPEDLPLSKDAQAQGDTQGNEAHVSEGEGKTQVSDSDDSGVESVEVPVDLTIAALREIIRQLRAIAVALARREIAIAEQSLRKYNKILEARNIRATFRQIGLGLLTSLSDLDTFIMKKLDILRMHAADRIAVRPIFDRSGYEINSEDPLVTRDGLPRALSMPCDLDALRDMSSISQLCVEYPEVLCDDTA